MISVVEPTAENLATISQRRNENPKKPPYLRLVGSPVEPASPRLAAIVAADMVNYSRHMAEDEVGTHARYKALRRAVIEPGLARHGARLIKHLGDGFLAEFGSATQAVWFAVRFQKAIRSWTARRAPAPRTEFRVGINLGDVIAEAHDFFGHSVNVAARVEAFAQPGSVLVTHVVAATVRDPRLRFEAAGNLSMKNITEPLCGFHVRVLSARPPRC